MAELEAKRVVGVVQVLNKQGSVPFDEEDEKVAGRDLPLRASASCIARRRVSSAPLPTQLHLPPAPPRAPQAGVTDVTGVTPRSPQAV